MLLMDGSATPKSGAGKAAISPPSHSTEPCSPAMMTSKVTGESTGSNRSSDKALDRAWTR